MSVDWDAYAKDIEAQIARIKEDVAPLERGEMRLAESINNGGWRDITPDMIKRHKSNIATYEAILKDIKEKRL
jgi:hypothetical protein